MIVPHDVAESACILWCEAVGRERYSVAYGGLDHLEGAGGAVVEHIVVAVHPVLGFEILEGEGGDAFGLDGIEVQREFSDGAPLAMVGPEEIFGGSGCGDVIGLTFHETVHEVGGIEVEHSPVDCEISKLRMVDSQSGMSLQLIYLGTLATYQQRHLGRTGL